MSRDLPDHGIGHHIHEKPSDIRSQPLVDKPIKSLPILFLKFLVHSRSSAGCAGFSTLWLWGQFDSNSIRIFNRLDSLLRLKIVRQLSRAMGPIFVEKDSEAQRENGIIENKAQMVGGVKTFSEALGCFRGGVGRRRCKVEALALVRGSTSTLDCGEGR